MNIYKIAFLGSLGIVAGMYLTMANQIRTTTSQLPEESSESVSYLSESLGVWRVTAYCPGECCCKPFADGITASGKPAVGLIVAAPPTMPFGTRLAIPGYSTASHPAVVEDRGGSIKGRRLDLLFPSHQEALEWGVKNIEINKIQ